VTLTVASLASAGSCPAEISAEAVNAVIAISGNFFIGAISLRDDFREVSD
jgi:hypothetical protein